MDVCGLKIIHEFEGGESILNTGTINGEVVIVTNKSVYYMNEAGEVKEVNNDSNKSL